PEGKVRLSHKVLVPREEGDEVVEAGSGEHGGGHHRGGGGGGHHGGGHRRGDDGGRGGRGGPPAPAPARPPPQPPSGWPRKRGPAPPGFAFLVAPGGPPMGPCETWGGGSRRGDIDAAPAPIFARSGTASARRRADAGRFLQDGGSVREARARQWHAGSRPACP